MLCGLSALGTLTTAAALGVIIGAKFKEGAWITVFVTIPPFGLSAGLNTSA